MKNKTIKVVTEGGKKFGFGHITRSLSIVSAFEKYGFSNSFIIDGDDSVKDMLKQTNYKIYDYKNQTNQLIKDISDADLVLIDAINISDGLIKQIEDSSLYTIFIDDEKRRNILDRGFVIDWTILCDKKEYFKPFKKDVTYILGTNYTPLRREFYQAKPNSIRDDINSIMVSFGGSDVRGLTLKVLQSLKEHFPNTIKNIVVGGGYEKLEKLKDYKDNFTNIFFNVNATDMIKIMQNSDIAIASGGQTLYELAKIGTPTISILLVDNAIEDTKGWDIVGFAKNIGKWNDTHLLENMIKNIKNLKDKNIRIDMHKKGLKYMGGNGVDKLVKKILEKL